MTIPRMRTIPEALKMIKEKDQDTSITLYAIKKLCQNSKINSIHIGNKILLNFDDLISLICNDKV